MMDFARQLNWSSRWRYAQWRARGAKGAQALFLKSGWPILLRREDYGVAYEIFVHKYYANKRSVRDADVKLIVDLGANVGYSSLYFLQHYPEATVVAFEPHPRHIEQLRKNIALNSVEPRFVLYPNAAGNEPGRVWLSDGGSSSAVTEPDAGRAQFEVERVDILAMFRGKRIDILKMDIEGGEYQILSDPRFRDLDVHSLVMEWHRCSDTRDDRAWCIESLTQAGYELEDIFTRDHYGMFWGYRRSDTHRAAEL